MTFVSCAYRKLPTRTPKFAPNTSRSHEVRFGARRRTRFRISNWCLTASDSAATATRPPDLTSRARVTRKWAIKANSKRIEANSNRVRTIHKSALQPRILPQSAIRHTQVGFIAQNPVSFAYTSPSRPPQNTFEFQPVFALHLWDKWYLRSAEANWTVGWHRHSPTMLPLSIGLGRTLVRPGLPPTSFFITGQWMLYRQYAPIAPQTTINFGITVAFPQFRSYWDD